MSRLVPANGGLAQGGRLIDGGSGPQGPRWQALLSCLGMGGAASRKKGDRVEASDLAGEPWARATDIEAKRLPREVQRQGDETQRETG